MVERVKSLDIDITSVCNLACPMCWGAPRGGYGDKKDRNMKLDEFDKILSFMRMSLEVVLSCLMVAKL